MKLLLGSAVALGIGWVGIRAGNHPPQTGHGKADSAVGQRATAAATLFAERCSSCHFTPDVRYPSDRIWVDQIRQTA